MSSSVVAVLVEKSPEIWKLGGGLRALHSPSVEKKRSGGAAGGLSVVVVGEGLV